MFSTALALIAWVGEVFPEELGYHGLFHLL